MPDTNPLDEWYATLASRGVIAQQERRRAEERAAQQQQGGYAALSRVDDDAVSLWHEEQRKNAEAARVEQLRQNYSAQTTVKGVISAQSSALSNAKADGERLTNEYRDRVYTSKGVLESSFSNMYSLRSSLTYLNSLESYLGELKRIAPTIQTSEQATQFKTIYDKAAREYISAASQCAYNGANIPADSVLGTNARADLDKALFYQTQALAVGDQITQAFREQELQRQAATGYQSPYAQQQAEERATAAAVKQSKVLAAAPSGASKGNPYNIDTQRQLWYDYEIGYRQVEASTNARPGTAVPLAVPSAKITPGALANINRGVYDTVLGLNIKTAPSSNWDEFYSGKQTDYQKQYGRYMAGGATSQPVYQDLLGKQKELQNLAQVQRGLDIGRGAASQIFGAQAAREEMDKPRELAPGVYTVPGTMKKIGSSGSSIYGNDNEWVSDVTIVPPKATRDILSGIMKPLGLTTSDPTIATLLGLTHAIFPDTKYVTTSKSVTAPLSKFMNKDSGASYSGMLIDEDTGKAYSPLVTGVVKSTKAEGVPSGLQSVTRSLFPPVPDKAVVYTAGLAAGVNWYNEKLGGITEQAYKTINVSGLPKQVKETGSFVTGFSSAIAATPSFLGSIPVAAEWVIGQPRSIPSKSVDIGTDMITGMYETEREYPGSLAGTLAGMYVSGKGLEYGYTKLGVGAAIGKMEKGALKTTGLMKEMVYPKLSSIFTGDPTLQTLNTRLGASLLRDYFGKSDVLITRAEPESFTTPNLKTTSAGEPATPFKTALGTLDESGLSSASPFAELDWTKGGEVGKNPQYLRIAAAGGDIFPETLKQSILTKISKGIDWLDVEGKQLYKLANEYSNTHGGKPVAVPTGKFMEYTTKYGAQLEPELGFLIGDKFPTETLKYQKTFAGFNQKGIPIYNTIISDTRGAINTVKQASVFKNIYENIKSNIRETKNIKSLTNEIIMENWDEMFGRQPSYGEHKYTMHSVETHTGWVVDRLSGMPELRGKYSPEVIKITGLAHDMLIQSIKGQEGIPSLYGEHGVVVAKAILDGVLDSRIKEVVGRTLTKSEKIEVAKAISGHSVIQPTTSGDIAGIIKTKFLKQPTLLGKALATIDRIALERFPGTVFDPARAWQFDFIPRTKGGEPAIKPARSGILSGVEGWYLPSAKGDMYGGGFGGAVDILYKERSAGAFPKQPPSVAEDVWFGRTKEIKAPAGSAAEGVVKSTYKGLTPEEYAKYKAYVTRETGSPIMEYINRRYGGYGINLKSYGSPIVIPSVYSTYGSKVEYTATQKLPSYSGYGAYTIPSSTRYVMGVVPSSRGTTYREAAAPKKETYGYEPPAAPKKGGGYASATPYKPIDLGTLSYPAPEAPQKGITYPTATPVEYPKTGTPPTGYPGVIITTQYPDIPIPPTTKYPSLTTPTYKPIPIPTVTTPPPTTTTPPQRKRKEEERKRRRRKRITPSHWEYAPGLYPSEASAFVLGIGGNYRATLPPGAARKVLGKAAVKRKTKKHVKHNREKPVASVSSGLLRFKGK